MRLPSSVHRSPINHSPNRSDRKFDRACSSPCTCGRVLALEAMDEAREGSRLQLQRQGRHLRQGGVCVVGRLRSLVVVGYGCCCCGVMTRGSIRKEPAMPTSGLCEECVDVNVQSIGTIHPNAANRRRSCPQTQNTCTQARRVSWHRRLKRIEESARYKSTKLHSQTTKQNI